MRERGFAPLVVDVLTAAPAVPPELEGRGAGRAHLADAAGGAAPSSWAASASPVLDWDGEAELTGGLMHAMRAARPGGRPMTPCRGRPPSPAGPRGRRRGGGRRGGRGARPEPAGAAARGSPWRGRLRRRGCHPASPGRHLALVGATRHGAARRRAGRVVGAAGPGRAGRRPADGRCCPRSPRAEETRAAGGAVTVTAAAVAARLAAPVLVALAAGAIVAVTGRPGRRTLGSVGPRRSRGRRGRPRGRRERRTATVAAGESKEIVIARPDRRGRWMMPDSPLDRGRASQRSGR